jgi:hypothetical protein
MAALLCFAGSGPGLTQVAEPDNVRPLKNENELRCQLTNMVAIHQDSMTCSLAELR